MNAAHMPPLSISFFQQLPPFCRERISNHFLMLDFSQDWHKLDTGHQNKLDGQFSVYQVNIDIFQSYLTDCHFAFDLSASNLATSFRSWTDTRTFHTTNRIKPMHTTERESPSTIMGILGGSGQPGKKERMRTDLYRNSILLNQVFFFFCCNLTIYLEIVCSGLRLTCHHVKWDPTLILRHHSALKWSALVIIWERTSTCMSKRKAGVHPISSSLWTTLCWERKRIHLSLLCCQWMWFSYQRLQCGVCVEHIIAFPISTQTIFSDNQIPDIVSLKYSHPPKKTRSFGYSHELQ